VGRRPPQAPRFGTGPRALTKGLWWAHSGWLFDREQTSKDKYAPDLVADPDIAMIHKLFGVTTVATLLGPMLLGGVITMSWSGALSALLWAGAVRIFLLHHVTWSVNSVCHVFGERPFATRDKAANVWPLAIVSFGESWHNLHHADPTSARADPWVRACRLGERRALAHPRAARAPSAARQLRARRRSGRVGVRLPVAMLKRTPRVPSRPWPSCTT
jgi:hypothetical protein